MEPKGKWNVELARVYYEILVGATSTAVDGTVRTVSVVEAHSSLANEVRQKLAHTTDTAMLATTGEVLCKSGRVFHEKHQLDFDPDVLGKSYLDRALKLEPDSILLHQVALEIAFLDRGGQSTVIPKGADPQVQYQALRSLPEAQSYLRLSLLAASAYTLAKDLEARHLDAATTRSAWETARQSAQDALQLAPAFQTAPDYGTALYNAHMVLGLLALKAGNRTDAVRAMMEAANAPRTEELAYAGTDFTLELPQLLYKAGERNPVADFLERFARTNVFERGFLEESAKNIRSGNAPLWMTTPPAR